MSPVYRMYPQREFSSFDALSMHRIVGSRQYQMRLQMIYINTGKYRTLYCIQILFVLRSNVEKLTSTKPLSIVASLYCLASFGVNAIGNIASKMQQN